jgi:hypothetical protein
MIYEQLADFIQNLMRMSHVYGFSRRGKKKAYAPPPGKD